MKKSLYGLKQAPRCWTERFSSFVKGFGFQVSSADPCFYIYERENVKMFLTIYVDDGLLAATHESIVNDFFCELNKDFKTTTTMNVKTFLGLEISRLENGSIFVNQEKYIESMLDRFHLKEANSVSTPIKIAWNAGSFENEKCDAPDREAVGCLMFVQVVSRPDISFAINVISRVLENPTLAHWKLVKRIFRYLKGTIDVGLLFCCENDVFEAFSDADFAGDIETRKSTTGTVCKHAGAAITWQSQKQQCVSLSTTEAEYVSAAACAKEIVWVKKILSDCALSVKNYDLFVDNMSAVVD